MDNYQDYFTITFSDRTISPCTVTIKPKSNGYTYGGGRMPGGYMDPCVIIHIEYYRKTGPYNNLSEVLLKDSLIIDLDEKGYGSGTITWSDYRVDGVVVGRTEHYDPAYFFSVYCYKE